MNLQIGHPFAFRSRVFQCHSLPVNIQTAAFICKYKMEFVCIHRQENLCKFCAIHGACAKVCKTKKSPGYLCKSVQIFRRAGCHRPPAAKGGAARGIMASAGQMRTPFSSDDRPHTLPGRGRFPPKLFDKPGG